MGSIYVAIIQRYTGANNTHDIEHGNNYDYHRYDLNHPFEPHACSHTCIDLCQITRKVFFPLFNDSVKNIAILEVFFPVIR